MKSTTTQAISDRSGSKYFEPGKSGQFFVAWVGSGQSSLVWVWLISPKNFSIFFPFRSKKSQWVRSKNTRVKDGWASYLPQVKSMLGSGQGMSTLFTFPCYVFTLLYLSYGPWLLLSQAAGPLTLFLLPKGFRAFNKRKSVRHPTLMFRSPSHNKQSPWILVLSLCHQGPRPLLTLV